LNFLTNPLPLREGTKGRGNLNGYCSPSPFPSPVKGEGTIGKFLCLFFGHIASFAVLTAGMNTFSGYLPSMYSHINDGSFVKKLKPGLRTTETRRHRGRQRPKPDFSEINSKEFKCFQVIKIFFRFSQCLCASVVENSFSTQIRKRVNFSSSRV